MPQSLSEIIAPDWAEALGPVESTVHELGEFLRAENAAGRRYLPAGRHVLRAFERPLADVKVLIVGQDPYPTPGHAIGLSFAVDPHVRPVPRSLANIYQELHDDLGLPTPTTGDLTPWADQGVLLLNRVLTVQAGSAGSHRGKGWEQVTQRAIEALVARGDLSSPCSGAGMRRGSRRCSATCRSSPRRIRRRCRPGPASSAPGPSRGSTSCWRSRVRRRSTGRCPEHSLGMTSAVRSERAEGTN